MTAPGPIKPSPMAPRKKRVPLGIFYMLGATVLFTVSSAISKWLTATYPVGEILFFRTVTSLVGLSLVFLPRTGLAVFRTRRLREHLTRGVSQTASQTSLIVALGMMPIASVTAINFTAPMFAVIASICLFGEMVGRMRWTALLVGFGGVLIITFPGAGAFQLGAAFALASAILYGTITAAVRGMSGTESSATLAMYQMVFLTVVYTAGLALGFVVPTWHDGAFLVLNGMINGLGHWWWTRSLHFAPASAVGPFNYFSLVWAMIIGFVVWGDLPTPNLLAGSAVVVGSGLMLLWHESRRYG